MGFWSSVGSAFSSVGRGIASVASKAWDTAKSVAGKAIDWMADKAESFIGTVKDVWAVVKPWVVKLAPHISTAISLLPFPWAGAVAKAVEKGIQALLALENSPILKKIEQAILWASKAAHHFREKYLTPSEVKEAEQRQQDLQEAMNAMQTEEQRQSFRFAAVINDYVLVQTRIQQILEKDEVKDFTHFLRLRATQKLLKSAEKTLTTSESIADITADDAFLIRAGADLLTDNPNLTDADAERLDSIIMRRFNGKSLLPFVFEEMIVAWQAKLENMEAKWNKSSKVTASLKRELKQLEVKIKIEPLSSDEEQQLVSLRIDTKTADYQLQQQGEENRVMQNYVFAAEGFLQVMEKSADQFEAEGREYIVHDVAEVGMLLIDCAQNGKQWQELSPDQQSLITDYANIFAADSKKRSQELIEAEVA